MKNTVLSNKKMHIELKQIVKYAKWANIFIFIFFAVPLISKAQQSLGLGTFHSIEINSNLNISMTQGNHYDVSVDAPQELRNDITVSIEKGVLKLVFGDKMKLADKKNQLENVKVYIKTPEIKKIALSKSAKVSIDGNIECSELKIQLKDKAQLTTGKINSLNEVSIDITDMTSFLGSITSKSLNLSANKNSNVKILKAAISKNANVSLKDEAKINIDQLSADKLSIEAKTSASAQITCEGKNIDAKTAGNSEIHLSGKASNSTLTAKDNSIINIQKLDCGAVKTTTEKTGRILR